MSVLSYIDTSRRLMVSPGVIRGWLGRLSWIWTENVRLLRPTDEHEAWARWERWISARTAACSVHSHTQLIRTVVSQSGARVRRNVIGVSVCLSIRDVVTFLSRIRFRGFDLGRGLETKFWCQSRWRNFGHGLNLKAKILVSADIEVKILVSVSVSMVWSCGLVLLNISAVYLLTCLKTHTSKLHAIFCACYRVAVARSSVMYFRFPGLRHVFT